MLHVTNGDVAAALIRQTGVSGEVVPWRDVLHEGPVPAGLPLEALSEKRARFIAASGWANFPEAMRQLSARDAALRGARRVTLWFEHDLYDQLQLLQILATLAQQPDTTAEMIVIDSFPGVRPFHALGQLSPAQLATLWPARRTVTNAHHTLAVRGWKAFTSADRRVLPAFVESDLSALPFLRAALQRLLEEFPTEPSGLSRTDRQILEAVAEGNGQLDEILRAIGQKEAAPFHGDASLQLHADALSAGPMPLLIGVPYQLTDAGRRVLAGEADARRFIPFDRWIGGVHLKG